MLRVVRPFLRVRVQDGDMLCCTEKAHLQSTQSTGSRHNSQTKHQALSKGQPGRRITPINTAAVHASAQQHPAIITLTQQGPHQILSANAAPCEA